MNLKIIEILFQFQKDSRDSVIDLQLKETDCLNMTMRIHLVATPKTT